MHAVVASLRIAGGRPLGEWEAVTMSTRGQRWTSLALSSILCGGLTLVGALGTSGNAGAMVPALGVTPSLLSLGEATLGTYAGPISFTMTIFSSSAITVTFGFSGTGADDYAWNFEQELRRALLTPRARSSPSPRPRRARWTCTSSPERSANVTPH